MNVVRQGTLAFALLIFGAATSASAATHTITASVENVDVTHATLNLSDGHTFSVLSGPASKTLLLVARGDRVSVTFSDGTKPVVTTLNIDAKATSWGQRAGTFAACFLFIVGLAALVTKGKPREFIIGADRRYSNSKTQLAFWFATVMAAYLATNVLRLWAGGSSFLGGVDIPNNLLIVSGLSALTYGGAKAITSQKVATAVASGGVSPKSTAAAPSITSDLFQNDLGEADVGDFQMILITAIAIVIFALKAINFLALIELSPKVTLPDIDLTLLSTFGIGQGAYLVKKMASNPGEG